METADGTCSFASFVECYNASAETSCLDTEEEPTTAAQPATTATTGTNAEQTTTSDSIIIASSNPESSTTLADTESTKPTAEQLKPTLTESESSSFFKPPTLYYFTGGLSAIITLALLVTMLAITTCLLCYKKSTNVGKKQVKSRDLVHTESKIGQSITGTVDGEKAQIKNCHDNPAYSIIGEVGDCSDNPAYAVMHTELSVESKQASNLHIPNQWEESAHFYEVIS